jgi:hypothetical protein
MKTAISSLVHPRDLFSDGKRAFVGEECQIAYFLRDREEVACEFRKPMLKLQRAWSLPGYWD